MYNTSNSLISPPPSCLTIYSSDNPSFESPELIGLCFSLAATPSLPASPRCRCAQVLSVQRVISSVHPVYLFRSLFLPPARPPSPLPEQRSPYHPPIPSLPPSPRQMRPPSPPLRAQPPSSRSSNPTIRLPPPSPHWPALPQPPPFTLALPPSLPPLLPFRVTAAGHTAEGRVGGRERRRRRRRRRAWLSIVTSPPAAAAAAPPTPLVPLPSLPPSLPRESAT